MTVPDDTARAEFVEAITKVAVEHEATVRGLLDLAAPSPASPAETREGRRPHLITKHPFVRDQYGDCAECGGAAEFHFSRMPTAGTGRMA